MTRFRPIPRRSAPPDFHDLLTDDLGNGEPSHVAGARAGMAVRPSVRPSVRPFAVRYTWPGGAWHSVAFGPDRETALANFARQNPHVTVLADEEGDSE